MPYRKAQSGRAGKPAHADGFSLIELMAAVAVFGILASIAIPPIYKSMDRMSSRQGADALSGRLRLARSQALSLNSDVIVYFNRDGNATYTVHIDNGGGTGLPDDPDFVPANKNNGNIDNNERVNQPIELAARTVFGYVPGGMNASGEFLTTAISFPGDPPRVTFSADGTADVNGHLAVMPLEEFLDQTPGNDYLVEIVSSTGEISAYRVEH